MSAQIFQFPRFYCRICRLRDGKYETKLHAGTWDTVPAGWSLVMRNADRTPSQHGWVA